MKILINAIAFQPGRFTCVLRSANQLPWLGTLAAALAAAVIVSWHLSLAQWPHREFSLLLAAGMLGAARDTLLVATGWLAYPSGTLLDNTAFHWILAMWVLLASTLNVSLRWLRGHWIIALLLGASAGPLAYYAGAGLGGEGISEPGPAFTALALGWAFCVPLLIRLSIRLAGTGAVPAAAEA